MCLLTANVPFPAPQFCLGQRVEATGSFEGGRVDRARGLIHGLVYNPSWDQQSIGWFYFIQFEDGISDDVHEDRLQLVN